MKIKFLGVSVLILFAVFFSSFVAAKMSSTPRFYEVFCPDVNSIKQACEGKTSTCIFHISDNQGHSWSGSVDAKLFPSLTTEVFLTSWPQEFYCEYRAKYGDSDMLYTLMTAKAHRTSREEGMDCYLKSEDRYCDSSKSTCKFACTEDQN